jgi:hypothetical protein
MLSGCEFFKNADYQDSIPLPYELPYADKQQVYSVHRFTVDWRRRPGRLFMDNESNNPPEYILEKTKDALDVFNEYLILIGPNPVINQDNKDHIKDLVDRIENTPYYLNPTTGIYIKELHDKLEDLL